MKKLNRLQIKPGNLLKDDELKTLRGGQQVQCAVYFDDHYQGLYDFLCFDSQSECDALCASAWTSHTNLLIHNKQNEKLFKINHIITVY